MIIRIPVIVITRDNGDGGYSIRAYNNEDELIADHHKNDEMTPELRKEILSGEDEYENGYLDKSVISINVPIGVNEIDGDKATLAKPISFHAGQ